MGILDFLWGKTKNDFSEYILKGAILLDVRTESEYNSGHISDALNVPLNELKNGVVSIKKLDKPVIVYCASGIRSAMGTKILKSNGIDAINGGGISKLKKLIANS